jgi:hypothetical protein
VILTALLNNPIKKNKIQDVLKKHVFAAVRRAEVVIESSFPLSVSAGLLVSPPSSQDILHCTRHV